MKTVLGGAVLGRAVIDIESIEGDLQRITVPNAQSITMGSAFSDDSIIIKGKHEYEFITAANRTDDSTIGWRGADALLQREVDRGTAPPLSAETRRYVTRLMGIYASQRVELYEQRKKYKAYVADFEKNKPTVLTFKQWSEKEGQH